MHNVESTHGSTYDTAGLHRSKDPGSGAFSPYYGTHTISVEPIEAGSEIFAAYGDTWIPDIEGAQVTFNANLEAAETFLRDDYYRFVQSKKSELPANVLEGLWNFTRDFPVHDNKIFTVLPRKVEWKDIANAIETTAEQKPDNAEEQDESDGASNEGEDDEGPELYDPASMVTRHFIRQQSKKPLEWLQRYGRCCDHIKPGVSTIPQAGRGAFASRDLPKDTVVAYSPLIHVGLEGEKLFNIPYGSKDPEYIPELDVDGKEIDDGGGYEMQDLVINYSFRHPESTLTLTPYGCMVNYINHATKGKYEPNVKLVWPDEEMVAHKPDWLYKNVTTLRNTLDKIGLSLDYVAIRDIKEGEEILLDYGAEWEAAWRKHVVAWEPMEDSEEYVHSSEWPQDEPLRTIDELDQGNHYPDNLETMCVQSYKQHPQTGAYIWLPVLRSTNDRVPCAVLQRQDAKETNKTLYRVEMYLGPEEEGGEEQVMEVDMVPHTQIFLTDRVKSADWHMPNTFRHPIGLPDDIMPAVWKNKKMTQAAANKKTSAASNAMPAGASASSSMPAGASMASKDEL